MRLTHEVRERKAPGQRSWRHLGHEEEHGCQTARDVEPPSARQEIEADKAVRTRSSLQSTRVLSLRGTTRKWEAETEADPS